MNRYQKAVLEVWREACRHIEILDSTRSILRQLVRLAPIRQIVIRRVDKQTCSIVTIAAAPTTTKTPISEHRREFSASEFKRFARWVQSGKLLRREKRNSGTLGLVLPPDINGDVIVAPLKGNNGADGVLIFLAQESRAFDDQHLSLFEMLSEPFSVALENDQRLHEFARLREAAEAERGALLRRLGRTNLEESIVGEQTGLKQVMERVNMVARSDVPVLILGETGTGKELVARAVHGRSSRHSGPFIRVNCGAIPSELVDSQLFGHEKGSFTGADQSRQGWFERADGGTLFLDEIGELSLEAQVRLLRVLQDGFIERVGGTQPIHLEVRVVAATHRDLATMVADGKFREDLWYRLAVFPILLPPLRERREDITALAKHFAERAAARFSIAACHPTAEDLHLLKNYDWPGNIRELGAVIDRAAILGDGKKLDIGKSLGAIENAPGKRTPRIPENSSSPVLPERKIIRLDEAIRRHIEDALAITSGRIEGAHGAAKLLGINPHTLRARMRKLGIDWSRFRSP